MNRQYKVNIFDGQTGKAIKGGIFKTFDNAYDYMDLNRIEGAKIEFINGPADRPEGSFFKVINKQLVRV